MPITIHFSTPVENKLAELARESGCADVAEYVQKLAEEKARQKLEDEATRKKFQQLADQWRRERGVTSRAQRMAELSSYREIISMGEAAVPLILEELEKTPDHWFIALHEITGASPVPEQSRGRLPEMASAWIQWGRDQGFAQPPYNVR